VVLTTHGQAHFPIFRKRGKIDSFVLKRIY
jgi:hypothetical protein